LKEDANRRFAPEALKALAGEKVFRRGQAYHCDGHVRVLALDARRVLAEVEGSETYRVELKGGGADIGGQCSCPAFEDWGFCKHMVATGLAANEAQIEGRDAPYAFERIREHLKAKSAAELVELILGLAEQDAALFRRLDLAASALAADDATLKGRLKDAIDRATRTGGYVDYGGARDWAERVNEALDAVADLASGPRAKLALEMAELAVDRIDKALNEIDDSDGYCGGCLERAAAIHLEAAQAAKPDPVELARRLFRREIDGCFDAFYGAARRYADVLGEGGLAEYKRLADEAWKKLPAKAAGRKGGEEQVPSYSRLMGILDFFAERDGDVDARTALRAKDLSTPWRYFELAEFCRSQGRKSEALTWAEEGLWAFEDERTADRLVDLAVALLIEAGRTTEAEAHLWRAFEKTPSEAGYRKLKQVCGDGVRERALATLEAWLKKEEPSLWRSPADVLVRILMLEEDYEAAWKAVRGHGASKGAREELARASEATHPKEALEIFGQRVEELATSGGGRAYEEAIGLIARMAALRDPREQAAYVADIKTRFARKRNFMKLLA